MVTGDKAWSLLESSACLFRVTGSLAGTAKDLLGQPRLLWCEYETLHSQVSACLPPLHSPVQLKLFRNLPLTLQSVGKAPEDAQHIWALILSHPW